MASTQNYGDLSDEALTHRLFDTERELVSARFQHSMNQLENTAELRSMRKDIARIKTEARRREIEQGLPKDALFRNHRSTYQTGQVADTAEGTDADEKGGFLQGIVDKLTGKE